MLFALPTVLTIFVKCIFYPCKDHLSYGLLLFVCIIFIYFNIKSILIQKDFFSFCRYIFLC